MTCFEAAKSPSAVTTEPATPTMSAFDAAAVGAAGSAAEMIVLGRRGHGQLAGLLLGSVSQKLVSLAPCAVVVVP